MSKKSRRQRTPNLPPEAFQVPVARPKQAPELNDEPAAPVRHTPVSVDLRREYGDVLSDLKLTVLIFLLLVAVMVALSFFVV